MPVFHTQNVLNGGEISPLLRGRVDQPRYSTNRILQLANRNGVMGFGTIGDVDDLTIFTVITN